MAVDTIRNVFLRSVNDGLKIIDSEYIIAAAEDAALCSHEHFRSKSKGEGCNRMAAKPLKRPFLCDCKSHGFELFCFPSLS